MRRKLKGEPIIMSRKGENIYKRKDGRWEGRYIKARSQSGKAVYGYVYAPTYKEAKRKRSQAIINIESNLTAFHKISENTIPPCFIRKLADDWMNSIQSQIKKSSYVKYHNILHSYILPKFDNVPLNELTSSRIQKFCDDLLIHGGSSGEGLSPKTVLDILSLMRSLLRYAQIQGYQPPSTGKEIIIRQTAPDTVVIPRSSQDILCRYLYANMSERNLGILLCLFTGMRVGEICALKWEDFSFQEKSIHVHNTMQRLQIPDSTTQKTCVVITSPKSKCSIRTIPIPDRLIQLIQKEFPNRQGYVLATVNEKYIEPRTMQNYFRYVQKQCGLVPVNFHALRHTFATRCIEFGFDIKSLSEILGHATVNITLNRYVHPSMELKQQNMQKLSSLLTVI